MISTTRGQGRAAGQQESALSLTCGSYVLLMSELCTLVRPATGRLVHSVCVGGVGEGLCLLSKVSLCSAKPCSPAYTRMLLSSGSTVASVPR